MVAALIAHPFKFYSHLDWSDVFDAFAAHYILVSVLSQPDIEAALLQSFIFVLRRNIQRGHFVENAAPSNSEANSL